MFSQKNNYLEAIEQLCRNHATLSNVFDRALATLLINLINDQHLSSHLKVFYLKFYLDSYAAIAGTNIKSNDLTKDDQAFQDGIASLAREFNADKDLVAQYQDHHISSFKNLNKIILTTLGYLLSGYKQESKSESIESQTSSPFLEFIVNTKIPEKSGKKQFIDKFNQLFLNEVASNKSSDFIDIISPYFFHYLRMINALPNLDISHVITRNQSIQDALNIGYAHAVKSKDDVYVHQGREDYTFKFNNIEIKTKAVRKKWLQSDTPKTILDIGTGDGSFVVKNTIKDKEGKFKIESFGLTATDLRRENLKNNEYLDQKHYNLGNAERLHETFPKTRFDMIVSQVTFTHLSDPAGAMIQAYERLKPGGVLLIEVIRLPGCEGYVDSIVQDLRNKGYIVAATLGAELRRATIQSIVIQKTLDHPILELPIQYDNSSTDSRRIRYRPLPHIKHDSFEKPFREGIDELIHKIQKETGIVEITSLKNIINKYTSLPGLMQSREYREADGRVQFFLLASMIKKSLAKSNIDELIIKANNFIKDQPAPQLFSDLEPFELFKKPAFQHLDLGEKVLLIQLMFIRKAVETSKSGEDEITFKQMGLPYEKLTQPLIHSSYLKDKLTINFSLQDKFILRAQTFQGFFTKQPQMDPPGSPAVHDERKIKK